MATNGKRSGSRKQGERKGREQAARRKTSEEAVAGKANFTEEMRTRRAGKRSTTEANGVTSNQEKRGPTPAMGTGAKEGSEDHERTREGEAIKDEPRYTGNKGK